MAERVPKEISDGFVNLERGMNSGLPPNLIGRNAAAFACNVTFRGGFPETRPPFKKPALAFESFELEQAYKTGFFQGASIYQSYSGRSVIVASIGGRLFRLEFKNRRAAKVQEISLAERNSSILPKAYFRQAEQFLIIQDGQSPAIIFDGAAARRADQSLNEVPVGTVMAYGDGRLWVAINENNFVAGDIVGGPSGSSMYGYTDSVLRFTENEYLAEGGSFYVPVRAGKITAMDFIAQPDTSLGQGSLVVFTKHAAVSVHVPFDRDLWKSVQYPIQVVSLLNYGALSDRSAVSVNGDIWYRAQDGFRSLRVARREQSEWAQTPMSLEMTAVLENDSEELLKFSSGVLFDNRLLMTANPKKHGRGCVHQNIVALDFHLLGGIGRQDVPAYDGIWTGIQPTQLIRGEIGGVERCFAFAVNSDGENELWEITRDRTGDDGDVRRVRAFIETASLPFGIGEGAQPSRPSELKRLQSGKLWVDRLQGAVNFDVKFRPDMGPCWYDWHSWVECNKNKDCDDDYDPAVCRTPKQYQPGYRSKMALPQPPDEAEVGQQKPARVGYEFQARIEWTGRARVKQFKMNALETQENPQGKIPQ